MANLIDLHMHSTFSDGTFTPEELFVNAKNLGIKTIAITDHDSINAIPLEYELSKKYDVNCIKGVELSTYSVTEIHILGYGFDENNKELQTALNDFSEKRIERVHCILEKLKKYNINLKYEELEQSPSIGRLHVANLLVKKGIVLSIPEAFEKYLGTNGVAYFPSRRISPFEGVKLINQAGGYATIAHPLRFLQRGILEDLIVGLIPHGLKGIEAFYPTHDDSTTSQLLALARKYKLIATGGTDFHGANRHVEMGSVKWSPDNYTKARLGIKE